MSITLITGGARSGKSFFAVESASAVDGKRLFVATAASLDDEMALRIKNHQIERAGLFETIEEQVVIQNLIPLFPQYRAVVLDCYATWLGNLYYHFGDDEEKVKTVVDQWLELLSNGLPDTELFIVTNEVGSGIVPSDRLSRSYRDMLGYVNRKTAAVSDSVFLAVCGIPVKIK